MDAGLGGRLLAGGGLTAIGLGLATQSPPRFYAVFALGTWLVADAVEELRFGTSLLADPPGLGKLVSMYGVFLALGLLADPILGISVTGLWLYPSYGSLLPYAVLYLVAYPAGGFFTYALLRAVAGADTLVRSRDPPAHGATVLASLSLGLLLVLGVGLWTPPRTAWSRVLLLGVAMLLQILILDTLAATRGWEGPVSHMGRRPSLMAPVAAATIIGALLHELPNVLRHEWRYQNLPIQTEILGVPLLVIAGWIVLVVGPWAVANALHPVDGS